ncbi:MAG: hypothetical protein GXP31_11830 [Kiritimatiellaeota bacterium]|nr:hypothetical protein [Kiritimatiellota bacterium]
MRSTPTPPKITRLGFASLVAVSRLTILAGAAVAGTELLTNPGFERVQGGNCPGWGPLSWGSPGAPDAVAHGGRVAWKLTGWGGIASARVPYAGQKVRVSGWIKTRNVVRGNRPWHKAALQIISLDRNGKAIGHFDVALVDGTQDWTHYQRTVRLSNAVAFISVHWHLWGKETRGEAWLDDLSLAFLDAPQYSDAPPDVRSANVTVDFADTLGNFRHLWIGSDVGYMDRVVSSTQINAMRFAHRFGFRYLRMHDCIHNPHIYSEDAAGRPHYDFATFDERIQTVVENGMRPVIVLETMPPELATGNDGLKWTNRYPARDAAALRKWQELIREVVSHCRARWGDAIHDWYFEVWNEPDSKGYFKGTLEQYLDIYDHAVAGATAADPGIRIGGPGGAGTGWLRPFLEHCRSGRNAATGARGCRIDFLSWHIYTVGTGIPVFANLTASLDTVKSLLGSLPPYRDLPTIVTEWGCASSPFPMHDRPYDAAFRMMAVQRFLDYDVALALPFALGAGPPHAHEGFQGSLAMFTKTTIPKPTFRAFQLLHRMRGVRIRTESSSTAVGALACVSPDKRRTWVMVYNLVENYRRPAYTTQLQLRLKDLPRGPWRCRAVSIAPGSCDPKPIWEKMGAPEKLTPEQHRRLLRASKLPAPVSLPVTNGVVEAAMPGFSVLFLEFSRGSAEVQAH